jgi:hypothetical protein
MNELKGLGMTILIILAVIGAGAIFLFVTCLVFPLRIHG